MERLSLNGFFRVSVYVMMRSVCVRFCYANAMVKHNGAKITNKKMKLFNIIIQTYAMQCDAQMGECTHAAS